MAGKEIKLKMVMTGPMSTGKTSLVHYFVYNEPAKFTMTTVGGAAFHQIALERDSTRFDIELWDTAGQERYSSLLPLYFRQANVALAVFDVSDIQSLDSLPNFLDILLQCSPHDCIIVVAANKRDLVQSNDDLQRTLDHASAILAPYLSAHNDQIISTLSDEYDEASYLKMVIQPTSATTGQGVEQILITIMDILESRINHGFTGKSSTGDGLVIENSPDSKDKKGCC